MMIGEYQGINITVEGEITGAEIVEIIETDIYKKYGDRDIESIDFKVVDDGYVDAKFTFYDEPYERFKRIKNV